MPKLPAEHTGWIIVASLMSTAGGLLFAWAYARAEASYLAVTEYSAFLWASALGWIVFHEKLSGYTLAGAALIIAGCLLAIRGKPAAPPEMDYT
jgi:S-adenosylmethionine uptake transporter